MARVVIERLNQLFRGPRGEAVQALRDVHLTVEDQELFVLVGPSGGGKTTLLRLIAGLEDVTAGAIALDGEVVNDRAPQDRDIAMVFQNGALFPHLTVSENLAFGLKLRKVPRPVIAQRVGEAAEILGLQSCLDRRPDALSGGERQRVAVGRAIVRQPKVFLFDEPLSNLDAPMRGQLRAEIARLHARLRTTMIYVTHDQVEAMILGDRLGVLQAGVLQQVGRPQELYRQPANRFVAGFIGSPPMNCFAGTVDRLADAVAFRECPCPGNGASAGFTLPLSARQQAQLGRRVGQPTLLGVRPEHLALETGAIPAAGTVTAVVNAVETLGAESHIRGSTGHHPLVARVFAGPLPAVGERVALRPDMARAHFFDPLNGARIET